MNSSPEQYLQFPGSRSGKLQVDNTSRVGNIQQLFKALLLANYTTWEKREQGYFNVKYVFPLEALIIQ